MAVASRQRWRRSYPLPKRCNLLPQSPHSRRDRLPLWSGCRKLISFHRRARSAFALVAPKCDSQQSRTHSGIRWRRTNRSAGTCACRNQLTGLVVAEIVEEIVGVLLLLPLGDLPGRIVLIIELGEHSAARIQILDLLQAFIARISVPAKIRDLRIRVGDRREPKRSLGRTGNIIDIGIVKSAQGIGFRGYSRHGVVTPIHE